MDLMSTGSVDHWGFDREVDVMYINGQKAKWKAGERLVEEKAPVARPVAVKAPVQPVKASNAEVAVGVGMLGAMLVAYLIGGVILVSLFAISPIFGLLVALVAASVAK